MTIEQIFENNQKFIEEKLALDSNYFENLSKGQSPEFLYIGCADSRVTAEQMMGANPGEIFVTRNIANMVINTDLSAMSVINYAVVHLKVNHVVVCGHYFCGGVKAAMQNADLGILNSYLREIRDVYRLHKNELDGIADEDARYNKLIELNVQEQCVNLMKTPEVQDAVKTRGLQVHGWVFDIKTGQLIDLKVDTDKLYSELKDIYQLS